MLLKFFLKLHGLIDKACVMERGWTNRQGGPKVGIVLGAPMVQICTAFELLGVNISNLNVHPKLLGELISSF